MPSPYNLAIQEHCSGRAIFTISVRPSDEVVVSFAQFAALEIAQQARHGLAGRADHLRDLLVREQNLEAHALRRLLWSRACRRRRR